MARAADEEQHDAVDVAIAACRRLAGASEIAGSVRPSVGDGAGVQEIAARQAVAESGGPGCVQTEHGMRSVVKKQFMVASWQRIKLH